MAFEENGKQERSPAPTHYAHTLPPPWTREEWELLGKHLADVERLTTGFADAFGAGGWGTLLGRWHDLGKYSDEFQQYLLASADADAGEDEHARGRVDHSTFGARHAAKTAGGHAGQLLAFCIAGHHGGLPDAVATEADQQRGTLKYRLDEQTYKVPRAAVPKEDLAPGKLALPFKPSGGNLGFQIAFFTRMLFSCLVDADRLATEAFCNPEVAAVRQSPAPSLDDLLAALQQHLQNKQQEAAPTPVNKARARVLADCVQAAAMPPGFFSLNVPTGGGKTLASLAFALHHAIHHRQTHPLRRIVVAIPFTSIIEQTADVYRTALGSLAERGLVEHHSNLDPKRETRSSKLAVENWDAPLIVTTNVQLYESLFAAATTPCRKLHRLARSVIVLDEAQTIPVELLRSTLEALRELVTHYGCTVVLCTATQPALERRDDFTIGLTDVRPIIQDVPALFTVLRRVEVTRLGQVSDDELAQRIADEPAALCIVNTRPHAAKLYDALIAKCGRDGCYHLSTFMCAQHRRDALNRIRQRLKEGKPCRLVSTQLIEAGVDVDFPAVYRAPAGFDSIAQAAGRCNREGLRDIGRVYVFDTETPPPPGLQRSAAQCARELSRFADPIMPEAVEAYFRLFYWSQQHLWDKHDVLPPLDDDLRDKTLRLKFRLAASRYKIIREEQTPILVPYNKEARAIHKRLLRGDPVDFMLLRAAQRYTVGVRDNWLDKLAQNCVAMQHESGLWLLTNEKAYAPDRGLSVDVVGMDASLLVQ